MNRVSSRRAPSLYHVPLASPTFHALQLVARIDQLRLDDLVDQALSAYLEGRLEAIHDALHEDSRRGRVVDLAARRAAAQATAKFLKPHHTHRRPGHRSSASAP